MSCNHWFSFSAKIPLGSGLGNAIDAKNAYGGRVCRYTLTEPFGQC